MGVSELKLTWGMNSAALLSRIHDNSKNKDALLCFLANKYLKILGKWNFLPDSKSNKSTNQYKNCNCYKNIPVTSK